MRSVRSSLSLPRAIWLTATITVGSLTCGDAGGGPARDAGDAGADAAMAGGPCDIVANSGCASPLACSIDRANRVVCDNASGKTVALGSTCMATTSSDTCKGGFFCGTADMREQIGLLCRKPCNTHADCAGPTGAQKCQLGLFHAMKVWMTCSGLCKPWAVNTCQSGETCTWTKADGLVCKPKGSLTAGAACTGANDCNGTLICFNGVCQQTCTLGTASCDASAPCATGKTCQQPAGSGLGDEQPCLGVCL